jgi:formamidopyrimidine-DNA glycosylase
MPEGHSIHRTARLQRELLAGRIVQIDSPQGRFSESAELLDGAALQTIEAYGKHLFYAFDGDRWVHVHLGLFGKFRMGPGAPPPVQGAVRMRITSEAGWVTLSGPTACDLIDANERRLILARIGPDPIRADARPAKAIERILRSPTPIGALLMDQSVIGGIGNIYRAELLFRAGVSPFRPGRSLERDALLGLWKDARVLMRDGERLGRIVTTRPEHRARRRGTPARGESFYVYHRTGSGCRICATPVEAAPMAARTVYWCPACQPESAAMSGPR